MPFLKAPRRACPSASSAIAISTPTRGTRSLCCACAIRGHATAAAPSSVMNSRRPTDIGLPPSPAPPVVGRPQSKIHFGLTAKCTLGHSGGSGLCLLAVVPDISRKLPVVSDLLLYHDVFSGDFLRGRTLGLEPESPDLTRRRGSTWLDIDRCEFRIADLFRHAFPHCANRGSAFHHARTRWERGGVLGVERRDAGEITLVEEIHPFRIHRFNLGLLREHRHDHPGH